MKKFGPKNFQSRKISNPNIFQVQNNIRLKKILFKEIFLKIYDQKFFIKQLFGPKNNLWLKKFWIDIILGPKISKSKESLSQQNFGSKEILDLKRIWSRKFWVQKNHSVQKIGSKRFGQNWISNSWDIPKSKQFWVKKFLVKINKTFRKFWLQKFWV